MRRFLAVMLFAFALPATAAAAALSVSCAASPTPAGMGQTVTWTAAPSGGTGSYTYSWTGTDGLTGALQSVMKQYSAAGTKNAAVTVSAGATSCSLTWQFDDSGTWIPGHQFCGNVPPPLQTTLKSGKEGEPCYNGGDEAIEPGGYCPGSYYGAPYLSGMLLTCKMSCSSVSPPESATASCAAIVGDLPDLTAGSVTPASAEPGIAVILSAPVTNQGEGGTGGGFTDLFEINPDQIPATFDGIQTLRTYQSGALDAGASNTMAVSYAFSSAGTYYVRACADLGLDNTGTINESNENNNCGDWTAVTAAEPGSSGASGASGASPANSVPGSAAFCAANPADPSCAPLAGASHVSAILLPHTLSISVGLSGTLHYVCTGASTATLTSDAGFSKTVSAGGSGGDQTVPATAATYILTCTDGAGNPAWDTSKITVAAPELQIDASPNLVRANDRSIISWSVVGSVDSCTVSGPGLSSHAVSGSEQETITQESTYTISCAAGGFHPSRSVTVKVAPSYGEF